MANLLTLDELAQWVGGSVIRKGPNDSFIGIAALDSAGPEEVSFLGNPKYRSQFLNTRAGAVIVPHDCTSGPEATALIAVENPSLAFSVLVKHFAARVAAFTPGIDPRASVDPTAEVDATTCRVHPGAVVMAGAILGEGCEIGPNAVIGEFARLGRECRIMANAVIRERCILRDRVILQPGAVIGADGYGYEPSNGRHVKIDQIGIVEIHDDVEVGANSTIDRARFGKTTIGEGTKIDNLVQIGHNCTIGKHGLIVSQTGIAGSTSIGDYVTIAAQSGLTGHIHIGDHATLAARSGVTKSLDGGKIYSGKPAVDLNEDRRNQVYLRRLPQLFDRVKTLEKSRPQGEESPP